MPNNNFQETTLFTSHTTNQAVNFHNSSCPSSCYSLHLQTNITLHAHIQLVATQETKPGQPRGTPYSSMKTKCNQKKSTSMTKEVAFFRAQSKGRPKQRKVVDGEQPDRMAWPPSLYFFPCLLYSGFTELHKKQGILKRRQAHRNIFQHILQCWEEGNSTEQLL